MTRHKFWILHLLLKPKLLFLRVLRVLRVLGGRRMGRNRVIERMLEDEIHDEIPDFDLLRLTISEPDQPLSILIEELGQTPETRYLDGYLDLAVLMSFQFAYKKDGYEYIRPDYCEAALRAKSEQDFRDIYLNLKQEACLSYARDMIVGSVVNLEGFRLVDSTLNIVSNMLFGEFKLATDEAFAPDDYLAVRFELFGVDRVLYSLEVMGSLVPLVRRVIKYKYPAIYILLDHCKSQYDFKCLCRGDLDFLKHKMNSFTDHERETVLAMELGL